MSMRRRIARSAREARARARDQALAELVFRMASP